MEDRGRRGLEFRSPRKWAARSYVMGNENVGHTYAQVIAERLRSDCRVLAARWLGQLNELLAVEREEIFPTEQLLDHIPDLITELAAYIVAPAVEELAANTSVVAKARELGLLRHAQRASV